MTRRAVGGACDADCAGARFGPAQQGAHAAGDSSRKSWVRIASKVTAYGATRWPTGTPHRCTRSNPAPSAEACGEPCTMQLAVVQTPRSQGRVGHGAAGHRTPKSTNQPFRSYRVCLVNRASVLTKQAGLFVFGRASPRGAGWSQCPPGQQWVQQPQGTVGRGPVATAPLHPGVEAVAGEGSMGGIAPTPAL